MNCQEPDGAGPGPGLPAETRRLAPKRDYHGVALDKASGGYLAFSDRNGGQKVFGGIFGTAEEAAAAHDTLVRQVHVVTNKTGSHVVMHNSVCNFPGIKEAEAAVAAATCAAAAPARAPA